MNFSEFVSLLYPFIGGGREQNEYMIYLTGLIMCEPTTNKEITAAQNDTYNPLSSLSRSLLEKMFCGSRPLAKRNASYFSSHLDKTKFIDVIYSLSDDAKDALQSALTVAGVDITKASIDEVCADLFVQIITAASHGQESVDVLTAPRRDSSGRRLSEIPLSSAYVDDGKLCIGGETINLPAQLLVTDEIAIHEQPYIEALLSAYADALGRDVVTKDDIPLLSARYQEHFSDQRKYYFSAESIQRSVREVYEDGENQFHILKEDAYEGVKEIYWGSYANGYERLEAVLIKITSTTLDKSVLAHIKNLIGNLEKKGVCHILVNDGRIKSWVNLDD